MLSSEVSTALQNCLREIEELGNKQNWSEAETITKAILPLLKCIGYGGNDYAQEFSTTTGPVDIALLPKTNRAWFVEAKRWSVALQDKEISQTLNYINNGGLKYAALTNGQEWRIYDNSIQGSPEAKQILTFKIWEPNFLEKFTLLSKGSMESTVLQDYTDHHMLRETLRKDLVDQGSALIGAVRSRLKKQYKMEVSKIELAACFEGLLDSRQHGSLPDSQYASPTLSQSQGQVPTASQKPLTATDGGLPKPNANPPSGDPEVTGTIEDACAAVLKYSKPRSVEIEGQIHKVESWRQVAETILSYLKSRDKLPDVPFRVSNHDKPKLIEADSDKLRQPKLVPGTDPKLTFEANLNTKSVAVFVRALWKQAGYPMEALKITWAPRLTKADHTS